MKLIKIPWDSGSMNANPGAKKAPDAIVAEIESFPLNEAGKKIAFDVDSVEVVESNFAETNNAIYEKVKAVKKDAVLLGGDHSITFAAVQAFAEENEGAGVLMIDAHPDCESDFLPPTHEDFIRGIINQKIIPAERILLVGIRNWHEDEEQFLREHNIKTITMHDIGLQGFEKTMKRIIAFVQDWKSLYLSLDIDAVDPAYAPATGYPEPNGFSAQEFITLVQEIRKLPNLKMADVVEINPEIDRNRMTVRLGAKVVTELISKGSL